VPPPSKVPQPSDPPLLRHFLRHCACRHNYLWRLVRAFRWVMTPLSESWFVCVFHSIQVLTQRSGTYGSRARCGSFDDGIWLAWHFLNTIVTNETSVIFQLPYQTTKPSATSCSTRSRINSKKHVSKEKIQTFTIV